MAEPPVLITGVAGFIGNALALRYLAEGRAVVGVDNLDPYYDVGLKEARLRRLDAFPSHAFHRLDLADRDGLGALFSRHGFRTVVHLAAQAGVRHSITAPHAYASSNLAGFLNVLEACRHGGVGHLVYASSSSVYGANTAMPYAVGQNVDHPLSLYAATKKANELMAHSYSHLYGLPTTGLRFFTVYGPWMRPDMAVYLFAKAITAGEPIRVFNEGRMLRDFTYVDDVVSGVRALADRPAAPDPAWSGAAPDPATSAAPYRVYNIGNSEPVALTEMIRLLEEALGRRAETVMLPMQPGDVAATCADVAALARDAGFRPATPLKEGIARFAEWYRGYHGAGAT